MSKNWIKVTTLFVGSLSVVFFVAGIGLGCCRFGEIPVNGETTVKATLPRGAFVLPKQSYDAIKEPFLALKFTPLSAQVPDLSKALAFFGVNGRPDAMLSSPLMHFAFNGNKTLKTIPAHERLYLNYDRTLNPPQYVFSPENAKTSLWIEPTLNNLEAVVKVGMKLNHENEIADQSEESAGNTENNTPVCLYAQFNLSSKDYAKFTGIPTASSELGTWRVDGSLLARQKARWYGFDCFLEKHGGEEFSLSKGKQRIDFGENQNLYSVFVKQGDCLIWEDDRWNIIEPGKKSLGYHLLLVKKVDERLMNFELWDVEGKGKTVLNLLKSSESFVAQNVEDTFRFVGARTRSQFVFEVDDERMLLRPQDWLVMTDEGWQKITTPEEIDAYVDRKLKGPLFIFDGIVRKDESQVILGTLFNESRTASQVVELPLPGGSSSPSRNERSRDGEENTLENPVVHGSYRHKTHAVERYDN